MRRSLVIAGLVLVTACDDAALNSPTGVSLRFENAFTGIATADAVLPSAYTSIMGETNNSFPHSVRNLRYQQVFSGSDVTNPEVIGLCLRRDDAVMSGQGTQTLAVRLGPTSLDYTTLGTNFSGNYSAAPTEVFSGDVTIPATSTAGTPADFDFCITFSQPYNHPAGSNLIVEMVNTSAASANLPRDACNGAEAGCTTARAFAFSATAENAALVQRGGLVMKLVSPAPPVEPEPVEPEEPPQPASRNECKKGGWVEFGFRNQGQCVRFVETGIDSRI